MGKGTEGTDSEGTEALRGLPGGARIVPPPRRSPGSRSIAGVVLHRRHAPHAARYACKCIACMCGEGGGRGGHGRRADSDSDSSGLGALPTATKRRRGQAAGDEPRKARR